MAGTLPAGLLFDPPTGVIYGTTTEAPGNYPVTITATNPAGVAPIVVSIVRERNERFGLPKSDLEARFDLRYCAAAASRSSVAPSAP